MTGNGNREGEEFAETDDIYLAAYYMYAACKYVGKRKAGTKVWFKFQNPAGSISELRDQFYTGAVGRLHDYAQKVIAAKQLLYD